MNNNNSKLIRLALLDDHQIVIDGLKLLLKDDSQFEVVLESTNSVDFLEKIKQFEFDIVITDIMLPGQINGLEVSRHLREHFPNIRILALTMNEDSKIVYELIEVVKIDGFLSKATGRDELISAITQIKQGKVYISEEAKKMTRCFSQIQNEQQKLKLSGRELEIVACIEHRLSNKQIADKLFISERTVETHRKNIYRKTDTKGEAALIALLKSNGIL